MSAECPHHPSLVILRDLLNLKRVVLKDDSSEWHCPGAQEIIRLEVIPILTPALPHPPLPGGQCREGFCQVGWTLEEKVVPATQSYLATFTEQGKAAGTDPNPNGSAHTGR